MKTLLHTLAHARTGDKGNRSSISLIAYEPRHWPLLVEQVTEERVAKLFAARKPTAVKRYLLPNLHAMNFVLDDVLDGGVNGSLNLDTHGKALSSLLLTLTLDVPETTT
ncbi:AtuA-related protein [Ramlibacter sp.]|uniref:AtuA-related protein n=1 Tax=Ramlibacter sp. TaxID=1917967 RepID=UPI003D097279